MVISSLFQTIRKLIEVNIERGMPDVASGPRFLRFHKFYCVKAKNPATKCHPSEH